MSEFLSCSRVVMSWFSRDELMAHWTAARVRQSRAAPPAEPQGVVGAHHLAQARVPQRLDSRFRVVVVGRMAMSIDEAGDNGGIEGALRGQSGCARVIA